MTGAATELAEAQEYFGPLTDVRVGLVPYTTMAYWEVWRTDRQGQYLSIMGAGWTFRAAMADAQRCIA